MNTPRTLEQSPIPELPGPT